MLDSLLDERKLPPLRTGEEMLDVLLEEEYGHMPPAPDEISYTVHENFIRSFCAGKASSSRVDVTVRLCGGEFTFPIYVSVPTAGGKHPFFVCVNFRDCVPDRYIPTEEIIDSGFAVISLCYEDVTKDNADFTDGLAGVLYKDGKRSKSSAGKIAMWAWAAQRAMDYAETLDNLDLSAGFVCGHSRLGKTALVAAATDKRFCGAYSNDSGCSGAAISRGKGGETIECICRTYSYWFCEGYQKYVKNEYSMPFDQHWLIASIAPRYVYVASAEDDSWADPKAEFLACAAASAAYKKYGKQGLVCVDRLPKTGEEFHEGSIGYHIRAGLHYFSREDWQRAIRFIKRHSEK